MNNNNNIESETPTPLGYNFNIYKQYVSNTFDGAKNSQSREQMHSVLDKLGPSLRQKNYFNFCRYVNTFFAIRNMIVMDIYIYIAACAFVSAPSET